MLLNLEFIPSNPKKLVQTVSEIADQRIWIRIFKVVDISGKRKTLDQGRGLPNE
jgi:hypothetical protein